MSRRKGVLQRLQQEDVQPPTEHQSVAQVVNTRGGNIVEVTLPDGRSTLCLLPNKFNKKLWLKRGGYAIIEEAPASQQPAQGEDADAATEAAAAAPSQQQHQQGTKITGTIVAVLYDEHIRELKKIPGAWPAEFTNEGRRAAPSQAQGQGSERGDAPQGQQGPGDAPREGSGGEDDDGEDSDSGLPALEANTNRKVIVHYVSSDDDDDDEEG